MIGTTTTTTTKVDFFPVRLAVNQIIQELSNFFLIFRVPIIFHGGSTPVFSEPVWPSGKALGW